MHIHCYSHDIPPPKKDDFDSRVVGELIAYLQRGGRQDIARWSHAVENTAWEGGHPLLWPGVRLIYTFSRN